MLRLMATSNLATRQHDKLYVLAQAVGWGVFTCSVLALAQLNKDITVDYISLFVASNCVGCLISHGYRSWINRRGWKQLGWQALLPRVMAALVVLALLWMLAAWPLDWLLNAAPRQDITMTARVVYGMFNAVWLFAIWSLLYFGYHFADRYRRSEVARAQLTATVKEAELRALKSQVNPHFIFNALNSLRALIDEDPARARLAVTQLASLLRYSLQSGQMETVPFEEELRIVKDYLALEQVRHEERLRLRLDVAPDTLHLPVPPMLLQTLVENAVKYGISTRPEGGEIAIIARCEGGTLRLQVTNPGELVPSSATAPARQANSSTGVGLRNAGERLRLLFGENAVLQLRADSPGTVVAEARIPLPQHLPAATVLVA
jgi:signal transduction histidine kinase